MNHQAHTRLSVLLLVLMAVLVPDIARGEGVEGITGSHGLDLSPLAYLPSSMSTEQTPHQIPLTAKRIHKGISVEEQSHRAKTLKALTVCAWSLLAFYFSDKEGWDEARAVSLIWFAGGVALIPEQPYEPDIEETED